MQEKTISSGHISIALCTYNGEQFLKEQLESIALQDRLPDELVICDDGSTDKTIRIIKDFALKVVFPVHLHINSNNLGSTKNFEKAIKLCKGNIIALCDQDDIWLPEKLSQIEALFLRSPNIGAVFTDAVVIDECQEVLHSSLWQVIGFTKGMQKKVVRGKAFELLLKGNFVTGATMAFRSIYTKDILPIPNDLRPQFRIHDGWISLVITGAGHITIIPKKLVKYRIHSSNQVGIQGISDIKTRYINAKRLRKQSLRESLLDNIQLYNYLQDLGTIPVDKMRFLDKRIKHLKERFELPENLIFRMAIITKEFLNFNYVRYSNGLYSTLRDLIIT
jgi:glycosyltransferase involved in cell wall biosynthesis